MPIVLITALVFNETEAIALGLEFQSLDDTTSGVGYVTAKYVDHSPADYSIIYTCKTQLLQRQPQ